MGALDERVPDRRGRISICSYEDCGGSLRCKTDRASAKQLRLESLRPDRIGVRKETPGIDARPSARARRPDARGSGTIARVRARRPAEEHRAEPAELLVLEHRRASSPPGAGAPRTRSWRRNMLSLARSFAPSSHTSATVARPSNTSVSSSPSATSATSTAGSRARNHQSSASKRRAGAVTSSGAPHGRVAASSAPGSTPSTAPGPAGGVAQACHVDTGRTRCLEIPRRRCLTGGRRAVACASP